MATIKLTGYKAGRQSTIGDTDTAVIDGSTVLGDDITEDTITVQAEFTSHLIPDADDTYDLGSASKKWRNGYFDQVNAKQRDVKLSFYNYGGTLRRFIRFNSTGVSSGTGGGVNAVMVAPADGSLLSVSIRAKNVGDNVSIAFHKASDTQGLPYNDWPETEAEIVDMESTNTTYKATFSSSTFSEGDILGISVVPTNGLEDVNITSVWLFDWNS